MAVAVHGLADLNRAFARADVTLKREMRGELAAAGVPVRDTAQALAHSRIPGVGDPRDESWGMMRIGVTQRVVYVAPKQRRSPGSRNRRRPNMAGLLMDRAMQPALDANVDNVLRRMDVLLGRVGRSWER